MKDSKSTNFRTTWLTVGGFAAVIIISAVVFTVLLTVFFDGVVERVSAEIRNVMASIDVNCTSEYIEDALSIKTEDSQLYCEIK